MCAQLKTFYVHAAGLVELDSSSYPIHVWPSFFHFSFLMNQPICLPSQQYTEVWAHQVPRCLWSSRPTCCWQSQRGRPWPNLQEYQEGHIGVEPLAMALFELFNTHAKVQQGDRTAGLCGAKKRKRYLEPVIQRYHVKKVYFYFSTHLLTNY